MLKIFIVCYLLLAIPAVIYRRKKLNDDLSIQGPPIRVLIYKIIMLMAALILWPLLLISNESQVSEGLTASDILVEVSEGFGNVARERKERELVERLLRFSSASFIWSIRS